MLIAGSVHDMSDIDFPRATADELVAFGDDVVAAFEARGITFTASRDEA